MAITGLGLITGLGRGAANHRLALRESRSALGPLTLFEAPGMPAVPVAEVSPGDLDAGERLSRGEALALAAAKDALGSHRPFGPGVIAVGTTTGGIFESEQHYLRHRGAEGAEDRWLLRHHAAGTVADQLALQLGLSGERHTFSTACSSSAHAIGHAASCVAEGAPWALAGGVDALCRLTYGGFHALKLLSTGSCRPFDRDRQGLSLGEGAAFLLLEPLAKARERGATVLGQVLGWGCASDAYHPTSPHPEGRGAIAAIEAALADAGLGPGEVDYVNAHGTGTRANDQVEALALKAVFGTKLPKVSSTKGATGHTLGAAGAIEAALCLLCLEAGFAPGTVGLNTADATLGLALVEAGGVHGPLQVALSNSFGFGGNNAALVLARSHP